MPNTSTTIETISQRTAILVSLQSSSHHPDDSLESLEELEHLLASLGVRAVATITQHRTEPRSNVVLGSGKLEGLRQMLQQQPDDSATIVVFDGQLSPGQQRNLAQELEVEVIDRTQVILRIFELRAKTRSAKLEIELARLKYELPRVRDETAGQRQSGGGARGGKGHTAAELRKQQLRKRLAALEFELETVSNLHQTRRLRRRAASRVALVGYSNAGKSAWMSALTGAEVSVEDRLFVTLDTTVRTLHPPVVPSIVVADTVGFLRNLPNELLASFRSTLAEALDAQLLLLVLDGAQPLWRSHLATTEEVLRQVHAEDIPRLVLINKCDRMTPSDEQSIAESESLKGALCVSAYTQEDVERVRRHIVAFFAGRLTRSELSVPFECASLRAEIWRDAQILEERYDELGMHLTVLAEASRLSSWLQQLSAPREEDDGDSS